MVDGSLRIGVDTRRNTCDSACMMTDAEKAVLTAMESVTLAPYQQAALRSLAGRAFLGPRADGAGAISRRGVTRNLAFVARHAHTPDDARPYRRPPKWRAS